MPRLPRLPPPIAKIRTKLSSFAPWLPCLLATAVFERGLRGVLGHQIGSGFHVSLWWAGLVLGAFVGWGALVGRLAFGHARSDPGLRAAWGMAALAMLGGVLSLTCLISRGLMTTLVVAGLFFVLLDLAVRREELWATARAWASPRRAGLLVGFAALGLVALAQAAPSGLEQAMYWHCDDAPSYVVFSAQMLSRGCVIQPFSIRGLNGYGAQAFLNALMMAQLPATYIALFDRGICLLVMFALVAWYPLRQRALALLPLALLVTVPNVRANTTSTMSAAVMLVALFRTAKLAPSRGRVPVGTGVVLALLATALAALRQSCLLPAALALGLLYGSLLVSSPRDERRAVLHDVLIVGLVALMMLLPWALSQFRSARALLHPVLSQNYNRAMNTYAGSGSRLALLRCLWDNVTFDRAIKTMPIFLLGGLLLKENTRLRPINAIYWASVVGFVALVVTFSWGTPWDNERILFSLEIALALVVTLGSLSRAEKLRRAGPRRASALLPAVIVSVAVLVQTNETRGNTEGMIYHSLDLIQAAETTPPTFVDPLNDAYRKLQAAIPPGARVLAMLDEPYRLDFRRNQIDVIDLPGMVSPGGTMPLDSDDALAAYLAAHQIEYFAFVRKEISVELYRQSVWTEVAKRGVAGPLMGAGMFKMFDRADSLARTHRVLYEASGMVVVQLAKHGLNGKG